MPCCCGIDSSACASCVPSSVTMSITIGNLSDPPGQSPLFGSQANLNFFEANNCVAKAQNLSGAYSLALQSATSTISKYGYDDGIVFIELTLYCFVAKFDFLFKPLGCGPKIGSGVLSNYVCWEGIDGPGGFYFASLANATNSLRQFCNSGSLSGSLSDRYRFQIGKTPPICTFADVGYPVFLYGFYHLTFDMSFSL
jgi:hypothetical protein